MEIRTCAESLLEAGTCCVGPCEAPADVAVLTDEGDHVVEHAACFNCLAEWEYLRGPAYVVGTKALDYGAEWGPA